MVGRKLIYKIKRNGATDWQLWGISLCGRDMDGVLKLVGENNRKPYWIATVNPEFVMAAQKDKDFKNLLQKTSLNVVDGIGLIWAKEVKGKDVIEKLKLGFEAGVQILHGKYRNSVVGGADLMKDFCQGERKVFFLGGWGDRAERTAKYFKSVNKSLKTRWSKGKPDVSDEEVIKQINEFEPDYLFVALGMKKQEEWIEANLSRLKCGVVMGVGRSFDYYSGELPRAPEWMRKMGMEWLFSLIMEPRRWKRQLVLPEFIIKVIFG